MEEVDNILIHTLRQIGCELSDDIVTLRGFSVEMVVQAASKCLGVISPEQFNIPSILPPSMSARFRIGSSLAAACQEIGYKGEIGYQTFLYANEQELRNIFMFLVEKLPKETAETIDEPLGKGVVLNHRIANVLKSQMSIPWTPSYTKRENLLHLGDNEWFLQGTSSFRHINIVEIEYPIGVKGKKLSSEQQRYYEQLPHIMQQVTNERDSYASIIEENSRLISGQHEWENEWNQIGMASKLSPQDYRNRKRARVLKRIRDKLLTGVQNTGGTSSLTNVGLKDLLDSIGDRNSKKAGKGSRFTHAEKLQFAQDEEKVNAERAIRQTELSQEETEEERQIKREKEISSLQDEYNKLSQKLQNTQLEIKQLTAQEQQVAEQSSSLETTNKEDEAAFRVKKKTFDLLPEAETNITKLQQLVESSSTRLLNLNEQWEKHRGPLVEKYRDLKEQTKHRTSEVESKIEQVRSLREKMKSAADETRGKDELLKQLMSEFESMSKNVNRSAYTKRILEIVGNIKKQKEQIASVLADTKSLQKDINFLNGKLDRTFTVTDELVFKDAKKDEFSRKAYKLLANLHEDFRNLVKTIEETGSLMREIRDLEEQVGGINEKEANENLEKISEDLEEMKKENAEMLFKIKRKK